MSVESNYSHKPIPIDSRKKETIFEDMRRNIRSYTPEWDMEAGLSDPGMVLLRLTSELYEDSLNKINRLYDRHKIEYLNQLGADQKTGIPARGVVTFEGDLPGQGGFIVKKGTRVLAEREDGSVIFETQNEIFVTNAEISGVYEVSRQYGKILKQYDLADMADIPEAERKPVTFELFDFEKGEGIEEHYLLIASSDVFALAQGEEITIYPCLEPESDSIDILADPERVRWSYLTEEGQELPFEQVTALEDKIILRKKQGDVLTPTVYEGEENIWIRLSLAGKSRLPNLVSKGIFISSQAEWVLPDSIFTVGQQRPEKFYPFGDTLTAGAECYISCDELLSKKNAVITMEFDLSYEKKEIRLENPQMEIVYHYIMKERLSMIMPEPAIICADEVVLEYFNGIGWARLYLDEQDIVLFNGRNPGKITVRFVCPSDIQAVEMGVREGLFIRFRLVRSENLYKNPGDMFVPQIENFHMSYAYPAPMKPERLILMDNTQKRELSPIFANGKQVSLFNPPFDSVSTLYISLTEKPLGAPISIFFSIQPCIGRPENPRLRFEYSAVKDGAPEFKLLSVSDMTDGMSHSGIMMFIPPEDFEEITYFGKTGYFIRVLDERRDYEKFGGRKPIIEGIYLNTAYVQNIERVENERFYVDIPEPSMEFPLSGQNIFDISVMVDERGILTEQEKETLEQEGVMIVREYDYAGNEMGFWVPWKRVDSFYESGPNDRHYCFDGITGILRFGTGVHGKIPPQSDREVIQVSFCSSHGREGNLEKEAIYRLESGIRGLRRVYNPVATHGGCNTESIEDVARRVIARFDHFDCAVSEKDFEKIICNHFRDVARVRCVEGIDLFGQKEDGVISIAVLMEDYREGSHVFSSRYGEILDEIVKRIPMTVPKQAIRLSEPLFVEISALINVKVNDMQDAYYVQKEIHEAVSRFIDMKSGGFGGKGFEIGDIPTEAKIRSYLRTLHLPCRIQRVILTGAYIKNGVRYEYEIESCDMPFAAGISGTHYITVDI